MLRSLRQRGPTERRTLLQAIHATARTLNMPDDARREFQQATVGVESCRDMTLPQLQKIYGTLSTMARAGVSRTYRLRARREQRDERQPLDTPSIEQTRLLEHLFDHVGMRVGAARMKFCQRICGHSWPQTRAEAIKLTEALRAMNARGWRAAGT